MDKWSYTLFEEKMGKKTSYGFIVGRTLGGKSTLAKAIARNLGINVLDMKASTETVRGELGTEDGPFEGDVPIEKVEANVMDQIDRKLAVNPKAKFIFDGYTHPNHEAFLAFTEKKIGCPEFIICCDAKDASIKTRWQKANEDGEFNEEV